MSALRQVQSEMNAGRYEEARRVLALHLRRQTRDAHAWYLMGRCWKSEGKIEEARSAFERSAGLKPDEPLAWGGVAECFRAREEDVRAIEAYERALAHAPAHPDAFRQYVGANVSMGLHEEAVALGRRGVEACGEDAGLLLSLAYAMNVAPGMDELELTRVHRRLAAATYAGPVRDALEFANEADPERPLRVGFLSGDFREHSCGFFLENPLRALGETSIRVHLLSTGGPEDETTERFKRLGAWRDCRGVSAEELARRVEADAIDVLVDLSGWTASGHMRAMAPRLAPVQATYLGYPNTTGLATMDARLVDAFTDPAGSEGLASERLVRLEPCFVCFTPERNWPEVSTRASREGKREQIVVTFGSFNNAMKITSAVLDAWARLLIGTPGAKLVLKGHGMSASLKRRIYATLGDAGVAAHRVEVLPFARTTQEHIAMYERVDVALDTFPYNGTTTTCEALWMGAAVVALRGAAHRSRVGASLLSAVGRGEWIAEDAEG